jgi:hypothetical protein
VAGMTSTIKERWQYQQRFKLEKIGNDLTAC